MSGAVGKSGGARKGAGRKPKEPGESLDLAALMDAAWPGQDRLETVQRLVRRANGGDVAAATLLFNQTYGKPHQRLPPEPPPPAESPLDLTRLTADELEIFQNLLSKASRATGGASPPESD